MQHNEINNIPSELKILNQWVAWVGEKKENGKTTKIPINPKTGKPAKVNDNSSWGTFDEALQSYIDDNLQGIGFVFQKTDPFVGIDIDNCLDPVTNSYNPEALSVIERFKSYTEISPSGKGLHIIVKGSLPEKGRKNGSVEMYDDGRFFTITGNVTDETQPEIVERQEALLDFHQQHFEKPLKHNVQGGNKDDDDALIHKAKAAANGYKFNRLWNGDWTDYPSQSEADLALCQLLSYWTNGNINQIDRMFRKSNLMREKWDKPSFANGETYGQATIKKAIGLTKSKNSYPEPNTQTNNKKQKFNLTEMGNSERLLFKYHQKIRYCHAWSSWMFWDGRRWVRDESDRIKAIAKEVVRSIYSEAKQTTDSSESQKILKHAAHAETDWPKQSEIK